MSTSPAEQSPSTPQEEPAPEIPPQPVKRATTAPRPRTPSTPRTPVLKIKVKKTSEEGKSIGDGPPPRKAPSPPTSLMRSLKSSSSLRTLRVKDDDKGEQMEKFQFMQSPIASPVSVDRNEVVMLRKKVEALETKLEELQKSVRTLQWHSDPQRQAALEDWAIERMVSEYNQFFPQPKSTIAELVRLFAASKQKSVLTTLELQHLGSLPRVMDVCVEDFMLTPPWFVQSREKDVKEIARYVVKHRDSDIRKRNWRLYKFATGRSPKSDAKPS